MKHQHNHFRTRLDFSLGFSTTASALIDAFAGVSLTTPTTYFNSLMAQHRRAGPEEPPRDNRCATTTMHDDDDECRRLPVL